MQVLLITNIFPSRENVHGGSFIRSRVAAIRDAGHSVEVCAVGALPRKATGTRPVQFGDATIEVGLADRILLRLGRIRRSLIIRSARAVVQSLHHEFKPDVVMAHGMFALGAGVVARQVAEEWGVPYSIHLHGSDVNCVMGRNPQAFAAAVSDASAVVGVSSALLASLRGLGLHNDNLRVIPNGVDVEVFRPYESAHEYKAHPILLFVGNLLPVKGADRLPAIARAAADRWPAAEVRVVGDGPLRRQLEGISNLVLLGRMEPHAVAREMSAASVVIIPSRNEGWPTVINESYACGTGVVGLDVGGVGEALIDERHMVKGEEFSSEEFLRVVDLFLKEEGTSFRKHATGFAWGKIVSKELDAVMSA